MGQGQEVLIMNLAFFLAVIIISLIELWVF